MDAAGVSTFRDPRHTRDAAEALALARNGTEDKS